MKAPNILFGLFLGVLSGFLSGSSGGFVKKIKTWEWEITWLAYSVWALLLLPAMLALATVPRLFQIISSVPWVTLALIFFCGVGWGCATVGFALGIRDVGLALTSVIVIGLGNAAGTLLPLILFYPDHLGRLDGLLIGGGVAVTVFGIILCSAAALLTERSLAPHAPQHSVQNKGIVICVLSGLLSILFNLGLIVGKPLAQMAVLSGTAPQNAANATWLVLLGGGFCVMFVYCFHQIDRKKSRFSLRLPETRINWLYILLMGLVWLAGVTLYGMSLSRLGLLGPSIGWPIFQCIQIVTANFWGALSGEWRGAPPKTNRIRVAGLAVLCAGIGIIGWAGRL